jgi:hypothetical protein
LTLIEPLKPSRRLFLWLKTQETPVVTGMVGVDRKLRRCPQPVNTLTLMVSLDEYDVEPLI